MNDSKCPTELIMEACNRKGLMFSLKMQIVHQFALSINRLSFKGCYILTNHATKFSLITNQSMFPTEIEMS